MLFSDLPAVPSILLADDNPHARRMGRQVLAEEGYQVWLASDGDEALDRALEHRPDLAIVGTRMNGLSGFDLCRRIKMDPELGHVRVILLAGPRETLEVDQESAAPSDGMLRKPLDPESVVRTVRALLDNKGAQADQRGGHSPPREPDADSAGTTTAPAPAPVPAESPAREDGPAADSGQTNESTASEETTRQDTSTPEDDPFADVVHTALAKIPGMDAAEVRKAVAAAVEAAVPGIVDRVTEQILKAMRKP